MKRSLVGLALSARMGIAVITATGVLGTSAFGDGRASRMVGGSAAPDGESGPGAVLAMITPADASSTQLSRVDPETLAPQPPGFGLGEYHGGWAFSPDREWLAVGTFARLGFLTTLSQRDCA
jgi:hypothetical protein